MDSSVIRIICVLLPFASFCSSILTYIACCLIISEKSVL
ncbi:MAG TPA: hypothetical protein PK604_04515 [Acetivibrio clariflavus]|nr:hypothetical protein [Acetivibrio clariflavus]HPU41191.1 hypothetical protein [Acetivibrio clariflavus]